MAGRVKTWVWVVLGIVVIGVLGVVAMAGVGFYFFSQHIETTTRRRPAAGTRVRAGHGAVHRPEAAHRARRARPLPAVEPRPAGAAQRPRPSSSTSWPSIPTTGRIVKVKIPFWLLRLKMRGGNDRLQRQPHGPRGSQADRRGPRALRADTHRRPHDRRRRACPRLVAVAVPSTRISLRHTPRFPAIFCSSAPGLRILRFPPAMMPRRIHHETTSSCPCSASLRSRWRRRPTRSSRRPRPTSPASAYSEDGPAALLRVPPRRLRQRISRRHQAGRKGRAASRRVHTIRTSGPGSAPTRATTAASATSSATGSRSAPATPRAIRRVPALRAGRRIRRLRPRDSRDQDTVRLSRAATAIRAGRYRRPIRTAPSGPYG